MSKAQFESSLAMQPGRQAGVMGGLEYKYVGKGIYEVVIHPDRYITQTAAAVYTTWEIPFAFRLIKFQWKHADAAGADSVDATAIILAESYADPPVMWFALYANAASLNSDTLVPFGESYEYAARRLRLTTTTTATDLIYPTLWLQELR